jgi:anaerobic magnesium-protoporphyrin IX monomethyl ester cyclase
MKLSFYVASYPSEPIEQFPLGVGYLASAIHARLGISLEQIQFARSLSEVLTFKPDLLAISSVTQVFDDANKVASVCKNRLNCFVAIGGYHISALPQSLTKNFDAGVVGEGEDTFCELVSLFGSDGHNLVSSLAEVQGICYHSEDSVLANPLRPPLADIDNIPFPIRAGNFVEGAYVSTSRGCLYNCTFCASCRFWKKIRYHSADYVIEDIDQLYKRFGVRSINILDDVFVADRKRFFSIVEGILAKGLQKQLSFHGFIRANLADDEIILALKEMNFRSIRFGAETGSAKILRYLKKDNVTVEHNQKMVDLCHIYDLRVGGSFVFGTPGETEEDIQDTISFLEHNRDVMEIMGFYMLQAVPGTELWDWAIDKGLVSEGMDWSKLVLDLQKDEFDWGKVAYLNNEVLPINRMKDIIATIRNEYLTEKRNTSLRKALLKFFNYFPYCFKKQKIRIEVGPGDSPKTGYIHCDVFAGKDVDYVCNAWAIPFKSNTVREIYARHVLEHLTLNEAKRTVKHWFAVLMPGGLLDVNVPDLEQHIKQFNQNGLSKYVDFEVTNNEHALAGFYGWQKGKYDIHRWGYTVNTLSELLKSAGFVNIRKVKDESLSGPLNLRLIAEKRGISSYLDLDQDSKKTRLLFVNWIGVTRKIMNKIIAIFFAGFILTFYDTLKKTLLTDYSDNGERQAAIDLRNIRADHIGRYKHASKFLRTGDIVLDCACGVGYGSYILSQDKKTSRIIGVDKSEKAIKFANRYYINEKISFQTNNIFMSNIQDNSIDCVVSFETVEHVDGRRLMEFFHRKLKKDGLLLVSTPNEDSLPFNKNQFPFHERHYTSLEFDDLLVSAGFTIIARHTQFDADKQEVSEGWGGLFNIAAAKKT